MFEHIESIVADPIRFKIKLAIGEDAYTSLRLKKSVTEAWDTLGAAGTAIGIAKSSAVATTFFAPTGVLGALGIGTAVTPIGWVVAAAVITGGAWAGVSRYVGKKSKGKTTVIPEFINTPMDVLGLALFDLMAPLALKVAFVDGKIHETEKAYIKQYFVNEWGYDAHFIDEAILVTKDKLHHFSIKGLASSLAELQKSNPDCNFEEMSAEIIKFLFAIIEVDGRIDEKEELALEKIEAIFAETGKLKLGKKMKEKADVCTKTVKKVLGDVSSSIPFPKKTS